ncbi:MAG: alginate lyase family protein [Lentisphaerae bacterium]|nr:alginate lyase family protein [Lentisphaerota bacterium]MBT4817131.1 alginate lyase family protein [Lentisphaerota bacterium]MBT5606134.1 alginate lyase family protein [Lentisphaerota bacterium]MBT7060193.1 alginate lyase family protein [Lentisphaerota bacterium]MBT7840415.1 alginate lyase family protein [Lentisphaerota bacterium]
MSRYEVFRLVGVQDMLEDVRAIPALARVREAVAGGGASAGRVYITHFRGRSFAAGALTDWAEKPRNPAYNTSSADACLAGHMSDGYSVYDVPETGVDWVNAPLTCLTRFPVFPRFTAAYHHTRDPKYARFLVDHMLELDAAYPMSEFPGKGTDGWVDDSHVAKPWHWCMICHRVRQMAEALALVRTCPEVTDAELLQLVHRLYQETYYLRTEMKVWVDRRHNGGLGMIQGMTSACALLDDFSAAGEWAEFNATMLIQYIHESFYPDGACIELTTAYSASVARQVQQLAYRIREREAIQTARPLFIAMVEWIVHLGRPAGRMPSFGDLYANDAGRSVYPPMLDWLGADWAKRVLLKGDGPLPEHAVWPSPDQEQWCGYYAMRSGWDPQARYMCIDAGPWGTTHQHGDRLSFVLSAYGADFVIDPSSTKYRNNEPDAFISTQNAAFLHNTITVDGVDETMRDPGNTRETTAPLDNSWKHGDGYSLFTSSYSFAPHRLVKWTRRLVFVGGQYWLLQDVLTGAPEAVDVEQNFQLERGCETVVDGNRVTVRASNGAQLAFVPLDHSLVPLSSFGDRTPHATYWPKPGPDGSARTYPHGRGWTGRGSNKLVPAPAVTYTGRLSLPATMTTLLVPVGPGQQNTVKAICEPGKDGQVWKLPNGARSLSVTTSPEEIAVGGHGR